MNILVSSDKNYLPVTATMLYSLSLHNQEEIKVWFLYNGILAEDRDLFVQYLKEKCGIEVIFVEVDKSLFKSIKVPLYIKHISLETYYRLIAQFLLPESLDRILWLDSDVIVKGNVMEFYSQNLDGLAMAACQNMGEGIGEDSNKYRLGLQKDSIYFNAGVLLLNLEYLRMNTSMNNIFQFCSENIERIRLQDQDILNMMFDGKVRVWTDQIYNCIVNSPQDFISPNICECCAIMHFAGWQKPWKLRWQDSNSKYYWQVKRQEGKLTLSEMFNKTVGYLWNKTNGNDIIRLLCSPYNWIRSRVTH